ncbi:MAG TPA: Gfo/Idh/MocA family oxidoreductase [Methylomirabilota bacterium]|nr:Gfo/Idh/MocA family oxidoreductase [Methylomirabilota bacterium]
MEPRVRIGLVGARAAAETHIRAMAHLRGSKADVVAVAAATRASAEAFARRHEVPLALDDYRALCERPDVDCVDVCCPNDLHHVVAIAAAGTGKHVIVEKPLTGYFGTDGERIEATPRERMLAGALANADAVLEACRAAGVTLCYAENIVYAPAIAKLKRLLEVSGGAFLDLRAEEAHSGSVAPYSRRWRTSGGGSLLRMGSHPIATLLHLKHAEGRLRGGRPIRARSVFAEVGALTRLPQVRAERRAYLQTGWQDVEDWAGALITFEDGTRGTILASDVSLGGVKNLVTAYMSNGVAQIAINPNTGMQLYAPDPGVWGEEYISEKVETRAGWQFPNPVEHWMRGYAEELTDFVDAILERRQPVSGGDLARETVEVIYAGYLSAATGRRVELPRKP